MKPVDFHGSWTLVTGASSGIGAEFARKLAHRGANLILTARSIDRLRSFADDLSNINGVQIRVIPADLSTLEGIRELLDGVDALGLSVEHVINNAGFGAVGAFVKTDPDVYRSMVRLNVEALTAITRHFLPHQLVIGRGGIIHVASTAAYQPTPFMSAYGATKAFVLNFSLALAEETRGTGVRVLALCPGPVPTGFQATAGIQQAGLMKLVRIDAARVVESALHAYDCGRDVAIPGTLNSIQTACSKLLPQKWITRFARLAMRNMGRD